VHAKISKYILADEKMQNDMQLGILKYFFKIHGCFKQVLYFIQFSLQGKIEKLPKSKCNFVFVEILDKLYI
jgi:hypothetical protein